MLGTLIKAYFWLFPKTKTSSCLTKSRYRRLTIMVPETPLQVLFQLLALHMYRERRQFAPELSRKIEQKFYQFLSVVLITLILPILQLILAPMLFTYKFEHLMKNHQQYIGRRSSR